jgi:uncharacterized protein YkwD
VLPRTRTALAAAAAIVVAGVLVSAVSAGTIRQAGRTNVLSAMPSLDRQIVAGINAARARRGLTRLRISAALRTAAHAHSCEMARGGYFSHDSADGSPPWTRLARYYPSAGYSRWQAGEAMLWYSPGTDAAQAVHDWLTSPEHRAILLAPAFREIGVSAEHATVAGGSFHGDEVTVVTADFGVRNR